MTLQVTVQESHQFEEHTPMIQMPLYTMQYLHIPIEKTIRIRIGEKCITADLILSKEEATEQILIMNQKLYQDLALPPTTFTIQALYIKDELCLGPFIAVLTEIKGKNDQPPFFGTIHEFCRELHHYGNQVGTVIFVTSLSKSRNNKGYYLLENNWVEATIPRPDFIYNRIHSKRAEKGKLFKQSLMKWDKNHSILFNSRFISKWEIHEKLQIATQLQAFLPSTTLYEHSTFLEWLDKYKDLFIKPVNGSQGRGIIHAYHQYNEILIERTNSSHQIKLQYTSAKEAASDIRKWVKGKSFIIQETLPLIQLENRKIDFRFLCHKMNAVDWTITSVVGRMSGDDQFVSNIAQGGNLLRPMELLIQCFPGKKAALTYQLMKDLALEVSKVVEISFEESFVELGIDIGVDSEGNPWLIEVNAKPSKKLDTDKNQIRPSAKAIIRYCHNIWKERSHHDDNIRNLNTDST
ncbi:YheC/YheD family endospore coat-associated protein [Heyndrickxia camelliae]|nr:YheC/YheD family protein [Heyndrickxia camelliae]